MKILVYGAGNLGGLYAALLKKSGQDISMLARGKRLADVREQGVQLVDFGTGNETTVHINVFERLEVEDAYSLVLVILPKNRVTEVLPVLAANRRTPNVLFFGNNAAGAEQIIEALGSNRVLFGFPGAAAVAYGSKTRYLILSAQEQPTTIGELDGTRSERIIAIADALRAAGFPVSICSNMDAWLKTHAAEISPTANALYMAAGDLHRLARTRDALVLMIRAIREGYKVLSAHGIPITPKSHRIFQWLPEPLLLVLMRRKLQSDTTTIKIGHARQARNEMKTIAGEFRELSRKSRVPTPSIDILSRFIDEETEPVPDGNAELPLHWRGVWIGVICMAVLFVWLFRLLR